MSFISLHASEKYYSDKDHFVFSKQITIDNKHIQNPH